MGLYLLNISVDNTDMTPSYKAEDLSINDQESIVEIVVEQILGFEDAIDEHDDADCEDGSRKNLGKIDFVAQSYPLATSPFHTIVLPRHTFARYAERPLLRFGEIDNPPPNA